jgi:hypothetical protein
LEQISGVVSPDISPDDYSSCARGCAAASTLEQRPQPCFLSIEIEFHDGDIAEYRSSATVGHIRDYRGKVIPTND